MFLQVFDLLIAIVSEVKFFKVKLHEYAPSNSYHTKLKCVMSCILILLCTLLLDLAIIHYNSYGI